MMFWLLGWNEVEKTGTKVSKDVELVKMPILSCSLETRQIRQRAAKITAHAILVHRWSGCDPAVLTLQLPKKPLHCVTSASELESKRYFNLSI